jgi:hypothetical protein
MPFPAVRFQWLGIAAALLLSGCPATSEDVRPPDDQFFFPSGMQIAPDESVLFVANSNSELRYDSGTVLALDLAAVDALVDEWKAGTVPADTAECTDCCERDASLPHIAICNEKRAVVAGGSVRTGNFATDLSLQELSNGNYRLFMPVRGDPSISWLDWDVAGQTLSCGGSGSLPRCDADHRMTQMRDDLDLPTLTDEPFNVFVDSTNGYAMVTHLTTGAVTLVDAPVDGSPPILADTIDGLFAANGSTGIRGAVGIAGRTPGADGDIIYVTSRSESRIQTLFVHRPRADELPIIVPGEFFFLSRIRPSDDSRGIAFGSNGDRAYVVNRDPATMQILDTSIESDGFPRNELLGAVEICAGGAEVLTGDAGKGERVFVSCFSSGQVWVINPVGALLEAIINVGRGPHAIALAPTRKRLYAANFLDDTVAVIDLEEGSGWENRVVLKLGRSRASGGD